MQTMLSIYIYLQHYRHFCKQPSASKMQHTSVE